MIFKTFQEDDFTAEFRTDLPLKIGLYGLQFCYNKQKLCLMKFGFFYILHQFFFLPKKL